MITEKLCGKILASNYQEFGVYPLHRLVEVNIIVLTCMIYSRLKDDEILRVTKDDGLLWQLPLPAKVWPVISHVFFLPPVNEVWGKVIFSQACVILFRGGLHSEGGRTIPPPSDTMGYGQRAGGTHPTGMHSCCEKTNTSIHPGAKGKKGKQLIWSAKAGTM